MKFQSNGYYALELVTQGTVMLESIHMFPILTAAILVLPKWLLEPLGSPIQTGSDFLVLKLAHTSVFYHLFIYLFNYLFTF